MQKTVNAYSMSVSEIFSVLEKVKDADWESCQPLQRLLTEQQVAISTDPSWRRAQLISILLGRLSEILLLESKESLIFSVSQRKTLSQTFDFLVGYAIRPNLVPAIWRSTQKTPTIDSRKALEEHRRLVGSVDLMLHFASTTQFGSLLYEKHLSDLLLAMFQLCCAPIRKVNDVEFEKKTKRRKANVLSSLLRGLQIESENEVVTVENVVAEMHSDRLDLLPKLDGLLTGLFQPAVIKCLMEILSHKNPAWLRKACSSRLSSALLVENGLAHLLVAVGDFFGSDVAEWKQVDTFASLVAHCPSFTDQPTYLTNIGEQLHRILFICKDPVQFRLVVAVLNSLLTTNPTFAAEHIVSRCFKNFVDILRGQGQITSKELDQHIEFVSNTLDVLPQDAVLLEVFAMFMPVYLKVALFSHGSVSVMGKQTSEMLEKLADKLEEGAQVMIGILDPEEVRFQMHRNVKPSFADDGGVQLTTYEDHAQDRVDHLSVDNHVDFFVALGKARPSLIPKLFLALLKRFDQLEEEVSTGEDVFFRVFVASLIAALNPLVQEPLHGNIEFLIEFALANLQRYLSESSATNNDDTLGLTLGMLETLASNSDQLSPTGLSRLKLAAELLKNIPGHLRERCADLSRVIGELDVMREVKCFQESDPFISWKFAPLATKTLMNIEWKLAESPEANEEEQVEWTEPSLEELVKRRIQRNKKFNNASVYGTLSEYSSVKDQLQNPDVATRGRGFIQLRKLLCARNSEAVQDLDTIIELCRQGMDEEDSYIYLGAVQCFALLVEIDTARQLPALTDVLGDTSCKDNRVRVLLAECLARCIPAFGDMMPTYSQRLIEVLLGCCGDAEDLMRVFGCSLLGEVLGRISNVERIFRQFLSVLVALVTSDPSEMVRWAAAEGLATLIRNQDKTILTRDYGGEVRDLHRVAKHLYANSDDHRLKSHLQEVLLGLGDIAKMLIQGAGQDQKFDSQIRKVKL